jgi:membrane protein DedA with SNARE-associated domain
MSDLVALIETHGYLIVAAAVLVEQLGVPLPAFPVLVIAGALAAKGSLSAPAVLALAVIAALIGDYVWFQAGRAYGSRIVGLLCRWSLASGDCIGQARGGFARFGLKALLVTRFVPGLAAAAPSLAGWSGYRRRDFALFDGAGALLWAGTGTALGAVFHREVEQVLALLAAFGAHALAIAGGLGLAAVVAVAWRARRRSAPSGCGCRA